MAVAGKAKPPPLTPIAPVFYDWDSIPLAAPYPDLSTIRVAVSGLCGSGKSTLLYRLLITIDSPSSKIGVNPECVKGKFHSSRPIEVYGIDERNRSKRAPVALLTSAHAIIYVVDSSAPHRLDEAAARFHSLFTEHPALRGRPILLMCNQQDRAALLSAYDLSAEAIARVFQVPGFATLPSVHRNAASAPADGADDVDGSEGKDRTDSDGSAGRRVTTAAAGAIAAALSPAIVIQPLIHIILGYCLFESSYVRAIETTLWYNYRGTPRPDLNGSEATSTGHLDDALHWLVRAVYRRANQPDPANSENWCAIA